jgi:hypothetical protein
MEKNIKKEEILDNIMNKQTIIVEKESPKLKRNIKNK